MAHFLCPNCDVVDATIVKDSRPWSNGRAIRRRRVCTACNHRFTTHELVVTHGERGLLRLGAIVRALRSHIDSLDELARDLDGPDTETGSDAESYTGRIVSVEERPGEFLGPEEFGEYDDQGRWVSKAGRKVDKRV